MNWLDALDFFVVDSDTLVRVGEVGVDGDVVPVEIHGYAADDLAVILGVGDEHEIQLWKTTNS